MTRYSSTRQADTRNTVKTAAELHENSIGSDGMLLGDINTVSVLSQQGSSSERNNEVSHELPK